MSILKEWKDNWCSISLTALGWKKLKLRECLMFWSVIFQLQLYSFQYDCHCNLCNCFICSCIYCVRNHNLSSSYAILFLIALYHCNRIVCFHMAGPLNCNFSLNVPFFSLAARAVPPSAPYPSPVKVGLWRPVFHRYLQAIWAFHGY